MPILDLFPTPVWTRQLPPDATGRIAAQISGLLEQNATEALQDRPELGELMDQVRDAAAAAIEELRVDHGGFLITGCWASVRPQDLAAQRSTQPNNYLSGLYIARLGGAGGRLACHDPRAQTAVYRPPVEAENRYNSRQAALSLEPGLLLLFPSWFEHALEVPQAGTGAFAGLAFNVMFERFGETLAPPRW